MINKRKVSVLVIAHNEESNIKKILLDILQQNESNYVLIKVSVVDDGSKDNTSEYVKSLKSPKTELITYRSNTGKVTRMSDFMKTFDGDILVQLDADIRIPSKDVISKLVQPFLENKEVDLVCGWHFPLKPKTFAEKLAYFGVMVWNRAIKIAGNPPRYMCIGQVRVFSRKFANNFSIPKKEQFLTEDVYSFYFAVKNNYTYKMVSDAVVYFKLPDNFRDYKKQMKRFLKSPSDGRKVFGEKLVKKYDVMNSGDKLLALMIEFFSNPFIAICYVILQGITRYEARSFQNDVKWEMIESSKKL